MAINTSRSYTEYVVSAPQAEFAIGFKDYNKDNRDVIHTTIDDKDPTTLGYTITRISPTVIKLDPAVPVAVPPHTVRLQRETNIDTSFHTFSDGAQWNALSMDENFEQIRHSQQESRDGYGKLRDDVLPLVDGLEEALQTAQEAAAAAEEAARAAEEAAEQSRSAENVMDAGGLNQQQINDTRYMDVSSLQMLVTMPLRAGVVYNVRSFWEGFDKGGGKFVWFPASNKSTHDGGFVVDPTKTFPTFTTLDQWYTPNTTGTGVLRRLSTDGAIWAEYYGALDNASLTLNHLAIQNALYKAASYSTPRIVDIDGGVYRQTGSIIISTYPNFGNTTRVPALRGRGRGKTEIWKIANSTIPNGVYRTAHTDIDCIVLMAGRVDNASENIIDARLEGIQFMRTGVASGVGFGVYSYKSIYYDHRNINAIQCNHAWYQNDCWMGQLNNIKADKYGSNAFSILSGTSVCGRNIYAANGQGRGFDLTGLTYSDLGIHSDGGGQGTVNGTSAIYAANAVGLKLLATCESHRGSEFEFSACEGIVINGNSYNTSAVQAGPIPKVKVTNSNVMFDGYSWQRSLNQLSAAEAAKYIFFTRDNNSNLEFRACRTSTAFKDYNQYVSDFRYIGDLKFQGYSEVNRTIKSVVSIAANTFKKLCYLGDANRFVIKQGITTATNQDRIYTFPTIGHAKSSIAQATEAVPNPTPTPLSTHIYINGVVDSADGGVTESQRYQLKGYIGLDGWLYVGTTVTGNNLEFSFEIVK